MAAHFPLNYTEKTSLQPCHHVINTESVFNFLQFCVTVRANQNKSFENTSRLDTPNPLVNPIHNDDGHGIRRDDPSLSYQY